MSIEERNEEINQALISRLGQLQAAIEAHEEKLRKMMVARESTYKYHKYEEIDYSQGMGVGEHQLWLGMIKLNGTWRLCRCSCYEDYCRQEEVPMEWKPLVDIPIEERIRAIPHIEKLKEAIVKSKETLLPDVEKAIAALAKGL